MESGAVAGWRLVGLLMLAACVAMAPAPSLAGGGFAAEGVPRYGADFTHFDYANPDAPKGCTVRLSSIGSFDSLNPFIIKGRANLGVYSLVYETLMEASADEIEVVYPRLAESMTMAPDDRAVTFVIDGRARWHDGTPVTSADIAFTVSAQTEFGRPFWRALFGSVTLHIVDARTVTFDLPADKPRQAALALAELQIVPAADFADRSFGETSLHLPLGSGPYRVAGIIPGRSITFERVQDYWGKDLPSLRGRYNFDRIVHEYFLNPQAQFEAFLKGLIDIHVEGDAQRWVTGYDVQPVRDGRIRRIEQRNWYTVGMNGFFFNLRQERFADRRVREALNLLFDFAWVNDNIFHGLYRRTASYFENSPLAAHEAPTPEEVALMRASGADLPPEAYTQPFRLPEPDGSGNDRAAMARALKLLEEAGYRLEGTQLLDRSGKPFDFVVLAQTRSQERVLGNYFRALERIGIHARLDVPDPTVLQARTTKGDFDILYRFIIPPTRPGVEQRRNWGSSDPGRSGSNVIGLADPAVDYVIDRLIEAPTTEEAAVAARVLDRLLQWGIYAIPGYYATHRQVAYWDRFAWPETLPAYDWGMDYWWCKEAAKP